MRSGVCLIVFYMYHGIYRGYGEKRPLYVGGLFELTEHWWINYTNFFPTIVEYAFDQIRNRSDILPDNYLQLVVKDTQGKNGLAARCLTELVAESPPKVAVIGPSLSDELTVTGQMAPFYNVIEMSYAATTATTVDRKLFPTLFKVNQIMESLNPLRIAMMKYFDWSRVGTIFYQDDMSVSQMSLFHERILDNNMTLLTSAVISDIDGIKPVIKRLKQFDVRVIMGAFRSNIAPAVFCEAFHQGMYGDSHVWILAGPTMYPNWIFKYADEASMGCTHDELITASDGHFTLDYVKLGKSYEPSISGMTPMEVLADLSRLIKTKPSMKMSSYAAWVYDTAWALALGLNHSTKYLENNGTTLDNYSYSCVFMDALGKGMHDVIFQGVSGPVSFDRSGGRIGTTCIQQTFNDTRKDVATYDHIHDNLTWVVPIASLWSDGTIPKDKFTYQQFEARSSREAFGIIVTFNSVGCLLAVALLVFNIYHRNKSSIKMSSPLLNNVILVGCLLMYTVVYITAVDYRHMLQRDISDDMCMVRIWLMSLGFTALFGALFSKTYRIYVIFRDYQFKRKSIQDYHLFGVVAVLLLIDCIILIPWTLIHALVKAKLVVNTQDKLDHNRIFSEVYFYCYNNYEAYWFAAMYIYKGLLLAFGTFLAWETRNVSIAALNDSKYIGACIYNVVIVCLFGAPIAHVLPIQQITLTFVLESCLIIFCTTVCQCIIFIPKVQTRNQVHGKFLKNSFTPSVNSAQTGVPSTTFNTIMHDKKTSSQNDACLDQDQIKEEDDDKQYLKEENEKLRMQIASESIAMAKLRKSVLETTGNVHFYRSGTEYVVFKSINGSSTLEEEIHENEV